MSPDRCTESERKLIKPSKLISMFCLCLLWFRNFFKKMFLGCNHLTLTYWVTWSKERPSYLVQRKARIERKRHNGILITVYIQAEFLLITGSQNKFLKNRREICGRTFWTRKRQWPLSIYYQVMSGLWLIIDDAHLEAT